MIWVRTEGSSSGALGSPVRRAAVRLWVMPLGRMRRSAPRRLREDSSPRRIEWLITRVRKMEEEPMETARARRRYRPELRLASWRSRRNARGRRRNLWSRELDRAASAIFHLFHFGGDDDAVVVTTEVRHVADLFEGILPEDKGTGFHALES